MGDRKDCAPAMLLDRQWSTNVVVFLLSVISPNGGDNPLQKDEEVLVDLRP